MKLLVFLLLLPTTCFSQEIKNIIGYSYSIIKDQKVVHLEAVGLASVNLNSKYKTTTIQSVASVSKSIMGVALMKAVDEKLVNLDEDINNYLPFKIINPHSKNGNYITLRNLATHTSGIIDSDKYWDNVYSSGTSASMTLKQFIKAYFISDGAFYEESNFSEYGSNVSYEYSNAASALVGYIVEVQAKMLFKDYVKEKIFVPLKMTHSGWGYNDIEQQNHTIHYDESLLEIKPYSLISYPDGDLKTDIEDLSIFLVELIKGYNGKSKLLTSTSWRELFKKQFSSSNPPKNNKLPGKNTGIFMLIKSDHTIGHSGSDPGIYTDMYFNKETGDGRVFMMNTTLNKKNLQEYKDIQSKIY